MADTVNLKKSFANLNERLAKVFDENGVRRSFTVPYVKGQDMGTHIQAVGQVADDSGGLTNNLVTSAHREGGKGWNSDEGETVGHPGDALRSTLIVKGDENAIAALQAAQKHLNNLRFLLGDDDSSVMQAQGQLDLLKKSDGVGMNLLDFGVMLLQSLYAPMQAAARAHQGTKPEGHSPQLTAPEAEQASGDQEAAAGGQEQEPAAPEAQGGAAPAGAASDASAAPAAAPAASAAPAQA
jgi:hypothetical protein